MDQLGPHWPEFTDTGSLVYIAAQKRSATVHMPEGDPVSYLVRHPTPLPFLLDESREVTHAYGVYKRLGIDSVNIARPATFVVATDGRIRYMYVGSNQLDRSPLDQVLEIFRSISKV
jgi:alkyl hydroperoxide reductase subunit AhpC